MKKKKESRPGEPLARKELLELHERVLQTVRKKSSKEGFRDLIKSGIYTPDGHLAPEYGGPPRQKKIRPRSRPKKKFVHVCEPATASQIRRDLGITKKDMRNAERALRDAGIEFMDTPKTAKKIAARMRSKKEGSGL